MATPAFIYAFDNLGPDRFTELCGLLLGSRYQGFLLGGIGPDGGIDAEIDDDLGEWQPESVSPLLNEVISPGELTIFQFKHKVTARVGQGQSRAQLLDLYQCGAAKTCELHRNLVMSKKSAGYVLMTNVEVNAQFRAKFIAQCKAENPGIAHYQVIGLDELESWVKMEPELRHLYFPTIFGPPRFDLIVQLNMALPLYPLEFPGFRLSDLLAVKVLNVGTATSYVGKICFVFIVDGKEQEYQIVNLRNAALAAMNPRPGTPLEPGRTQSYYYQFSDFSEALTKGKDVFPVEVRVYDEIDNVYRTAISDDFRAKILSDARLSMP